MWDWLFQFVDPLERAGVPYAIVGSVASAVYGEPRATNDFDFLIQLSRADAGRLAVGGNDLDRGLIERAVTQLGLADQWQAVQGNP